MKNKLLKIALAIVIAVLFVSCGARKVNKEVNKENIKENTSVTINEKQKDSSYTIVDEKLRLNIEKSTFNFEPIDNTKPFFIGSQKYENVKVVSSKENQDVEQLKNQLTQNIKTNEVYFDFINELDKEVYQYKKDLKSLQLWGLLIVLFFVLVILIILWYFNRKVKQATGVIKVAKHFNL